MLANSLQKQQEAEAPAQQPGRDAKGRFQKGRSGNPQGRFRKGETGNPAGRPPGARNKATMMAELLLDGEAEALTRKALELALAGDATALRMCLDRIIPPRRQRRVELPVPEVASVADLGTAMAAITNAAAHGTITPSEAAELARVVEIFVRAVEASDFDRRLRALEAEDDAATC